MRWGIIDCSVYVPRLRVTREVLMSAPGASRVDLVEKAVPDIDEDTLTMAASCARELIARHAGDRQRIGVLTFGSSNPPYAEKPTCGALAAFLGLPSGLVTSEHTSSCRAGSEAFLAAGGFLAAMPEKLALVVVADAPRGVSPGALEDGAGAGAVAMLCGVDDCAVEVEAFSSQVGEWPGVRFRPAGGGATLDLGLARYADMAVESCVMPAVKDVMAHAGTSPRDYRGAALPQFDGRGPKSLAAKIGLDPKLIAACTVQPRIGDAGAATPLIGLACGLDRAAVNDRLLLVTFAPGGACDAISLRVRAAPGPKSGWERYIEDRQHLDWAAYASLRAAQRAGV